MPRTAYSDVHVLPYGIQMIEEITQRQFSSHRTHTANTQTQLQPRTPKDWFKAQWAMLEGCSFSSDIFSYTEWVMKWNDNRQHAQERQIPKRPLLLEELVTSKTPFYRSVLYFANLLLCSAAILPKGKREKGSERTGRRKAALLQEPEPVTECKKQNQTFW